MLTVFVMAWSLSGGFIVVVSGAGLTLTSQHVMDVLSCQLGQQQEPVDSGAWAALLVAQLFLHTSGVGLAWQCACRAMHAAQSTQHAEGCWSCALAWLLLCL